jgi:hypothetical protein
LQQQQQQHEVVHVQQPFTLCQDQEIDALIQETNNSLIGHSNGKMKQLSASAKSSANKASSSANNKIDNISHEIKICKSKTSATFD